MEEKGIDIAGFDGTTFDAGSMDCYDEVTANSACKIYN